METISDDVKRMFEMNSAYAVQVVKQVNFGPLESKKYFITSAATDGEEKFTEVSERGLIDANYKKLNTWVFLRLTH